MKIVIFLTLISLSALSYHQSFKFNKNTDDHYIISYLENKKFILDHILVPEKKLQRLVSRNFFNTQKELEVFRTKKFSRYLRQKSRFVKSNYINSESNDVIWKVKNSWSLEWERRFAQWVDKEFNENFFVTYKISTDCADVAFALRWIFSRINSLPAANTLAGSHIIFSQDSFKSEWKKLKRHELWNKDEVFINALNYLMKHAYTGTLNIDGYPIELNKESFLVGTIHLDGGHTMVISEINTNGTIPIKKLSSTVPSKIRKLFNEIMIDQQITNKELGGLFRMRWPIKKDNTWTLIPKEEMPLYSLEQYSKDFLQGNSSFTLALIDKLGIKFKPKDIITESINSLLKSLKERITIVQEGHQFCSRNDCSEGSFNYEEYSTPTRDSRINTSFKTLKNLTKQLNDFDTTLIKHYQKTLDSTYLEVYDKSFKLKDLEELFHYAIPSHHPSDSIELRWALDEKAMQKALTKKFNRLKRKRHSLISEAQICKSQDCSRGTELYDKLNTFEIDFIFKNKVYMAFNFIKEKYELSSSFKNLQSEIDRIPFYKSEPKSQFRWAQNINTNDYIFNSFNSRNIMELDDNILLVDFALVNINTGKRINLLKASQFYYNEESKNLLAVKDKTLYILNLKGEIIEFKEFNEKINRLQWIGHSYFIVHKSQTIENLKTNHIYKISKHKISEYMEIPSTNSSYYNMNQVYYERIKKDNLSTYTSYNKIFYQKGVELIKRSMPVGFTLYSFKNEKASYTHKGHLYIEKANDQICKIKIDKELLVRQLYFNNELLELGPNGRSGSEYYAVKECQLSKKLLSSNEYSLASQVDEAKLIRVFGPIPEVYLFKNNKLEKIKGPKGFEFSSLNPESYYFIKHTEDSIVDYISINRKTNKVTQMSRYHILNFCNQELPYFKKCDSRSNAYSSSFYKYADPIITYTSIYINNFHLLDTLIKYVQSSDVLYYENYSLKSFDRYELAPGVQFTIKKKL